jgi:hypothetical protein
MNKDSIGFWSSLDTMIYKLARPVTKVFFKNKFVNLQTAVIIALISMVLLRFLGGLLSRILVNFLQGFPV